MDPDTTSSLIASAEAGPTTLQVVLLCVLPVLVCGSAFFSGSETALFGLTVSERLELRRQRSVGARAAIQLLLRPRLLLILLLLGNMTMNVLYFIVSSMLMMNDLFNWLGDLLFGIGVLLGMVICGELLPKFIASVFRQRYLRFVSPILLALFQGLRPLWIALDRLIVTPLSRLAVPDQSVDELSGEELQALVELSGRDGVVDAGEQQRLGDVLRIGSTIVRRAMIPRTRIKSLPIDADEDAVRTLVRRTRLTRIPIHEESPDSIAGILHVKTWLTNLRHGRSDLRDAMSPANYVPEVATLDKVLDHFRTTSTQMAIAVDEYGGTAGLITLQDVVEQFVGEIDNPDATETRHARSIGPDQWIVDGNAASTAWIDLFGVTLGFLPAATVGGLVTQLLNRKPEVGDVARLANVRMEVHHVEHDQVVTVLLTLERGEEDGS
ncbi:MAG: hemolysin family protein [Planctomycetota bacterium]|nr:hemolysin family protein [Planctomycetota bacterium]